MALITQPTKIPTVTNITMMLKTEFQPSLLTPKPFYDSFTPSPAHLFLRSSAYR